MNRSILTAALAVAAVVFAYAITSATRPVRSVGIGVPIRHDDFLFTVQRISAQRSREMTRYYVAILVENQAVRVDYRWRDGIAYVAGSDGRRYQPTSNGAFELAPGESRTAHIAFDIPRAVHDPLLRFWDGIFMGDAFNGAAYAKTGVPLERY